MTSTIDNVIVILEANARSRRKNARTTASGRVVAQVMKTDDSRLIGRTFHSTIADISPSGMRLMTDIRLERCTLDLFVKVDGLSRTMLLKTEVRWVSQQKSGDYLVGAEICDTQASDTDAWGEFQGDHWRQSL